VRLFLASDCFGQYGLLVVAVRVRPRLGRVEAKGGQFDVQSRRDDNKPDAPRDKIDLILLWEWWGGCGAARGYATQRQIVRLGTTD
jgi:hypothetical protein